MDEEGAVADTVALMATLLEGKQLVHLSLLAPTGEVLGQRTTSNTRPEYECRNGRGHQVVPGMSRDGDYCINASLP